MEPFPWNEFQSVCSSCPDLVCELLPKREDGLDSFDLRTLPPFTRLHRRLRAFWAADSQSARTIRSGHEYDRNGILAIPSKNAKAPGAQPNELETSFYGS